MTIAELATVTGVSAHTLRYYERAGLVPLVERDPSSGHRRYSRGHVGWIEFLRNLRTAGMPVREMRAYARLVARGDGTWPQRQAMLKAHRAHVDAMIRRLQAHRRVLDRKVRAGCAPPRLEVAD
ncbi:MAG TPA: MerR family transcriptional regulator [Gemmatimonadales bacterium]|nr:MerR family transcriptional regulator [Gemmatimonadales bacterium]